MDVNQLFFKAVTHIVNLVYNNLFILAFIIDYQEEY